MSEVLRVRRYIPEWLLRLAGCCQFHRFGRQKGVHRGMAETPWRRNK